MAVWELALVIFAITYLMVNTVYLFIYMNMMKKMNGVVTKSIKLMEKLMDKSEKVIDELYEDDNL